MSRRKESIEKYKKQLVDSGVSVDDSLLEKVTIGCGPSIYKADAETVAGSDSKELETVKKNFLIKKLGLDDSPELDNAINEAIETIGKSTKSKYRPAFYYILVKKFGKESIYS